MKRQTERQERVKYPRAIVDTEEIKRQVQREVNFNKVVNNSATFKKSTEEKEQLKIAKAEWNRYIKGS